jgi:hypothetical protein
MKNGYRGMVANRIRKFRLMFSCFKEVSKKRKYSPPVIATVCYAAIGKT